MSLVMTFDATTPGERIASVLTDYQFEMIVRDRARAACERLAEALDSSEYHTSVTFIFTSTGGEWTVKGGNSYATTQTSNGEVLSGTTEAVIVHARAVGRAKLNLLAPPPPRAGIELVEPTHAEQSQSDPADEIPF